MSDNDAAGDLVSRPNTETPKPQTPRRDLGETHDASGSSVVSGPAGKSPGESQVEAEAEADAADGSFLRFLAPADRHGVLGRLDYYEILEVVGKGGMGVVLKAFDARLHRVVAVKVMAPYLARNPAARKRFVREAQAGAAVNHKHVVAIHAVEAQHRPPYLVMEFVAGRSLADRIEKEGPPPVKEILRIGGEIAEGLAAAHAQGLIHRDIKPANILLEDGTERVKITDFGLARAADDASLTQSGVVSGTPKYMSPEQALGQRLDARSDLFSLGSVLYFLCTAHPPFRAGNTLAVLSQVVKDAPPPIHELNPAIPAWLCDLTTKLMAKDPVERLQSAQEVAEILSQRLADLPQDLGAAAAAGSREGIAKEPSLDGRRECGVVTVDYKPVEPAFQARRAAPRRRPWVWLTAGVAASVAAATLAPVLFWHGVGRPDVSVRPAVCKVEQFAVPAKDVTFGYRSFQYESTVPGCQAEVNGGRLLLRGDHDEGDQRLFITARNVTGREQWPDSLDVELKLGGTANNNLAWHVGVSIGRVKVLFHPNYPYGAFRAEEVNTHRFLFNNENMGFTPAADVLHPMTIRVRRSDQVFRFEVTVVDAKNGGKYQKEFEVGADQMGSYDRVGLERSGRRGGDALFESLSIKAGS